MTAFACNSGGVQNWDSKTGGSVTMCVYAITHRESGRSYVGQTRGKAFRRWQFHCAPSNKNKRGIGGALRKYGKGAFDFAVIDIAESNEQLDHKEKFWITKLQTMSPNGFNLDSGGNKQKKVSDATRKAQRESRARWLVSGADTKVLGSGSRGRRRRPDEIAAIKAGLRGRPVSDITKERISAKQRGIAKPEARVIAMARARMKGCVVVCEDGHVFLSFFEAAKHSGLNKIAIFHATNGVTKRCGGLRWWLDLREPQ